MSWEVEEWQKQKSQSSPCPCKQAMSHLHAEGTVGFPSLRQPFHCYFPPVIWSIQFALYPFLGKSLYSTTCGNLHSDNVIKQLNHATVRQTCQVHFREKSYFLYWMTINFTICLKHHPTPTLPPPPRLSLTPFTPLIGNIKSMG